MHRPTIVTPSTVVATPSAVRKPSIDQQELNARLLEAVEYGFSDKVKSAIELKADVHAPNPTDGKRAMYIAARLATEQYGAGDFQASNDFVAIVSLLAQAGANQSEDLVDFLHKEPIKTAYQKLQEDEAKKEESDDEEEDEE